MSALMPVRSDELEAVLLSFKVTAVALIVSLPIGLVLGWVLARGKFRGKVLLESACMLPLVLPPVVVGYLLLVLFGRSGLLGAPLYDHFGIRFAFTWFSAALACGVVSFPLLLRSVKLGFAAIDPRLELMSRSLGASRWRTFFSVSLRLCVPAIVSGSLLAFARGWGEFGATIMIAGNIAGETRTVPLAIYGAIDRPRGIDAAWPLVLISIIAATGAVFISEWLTQHTAMRMRRGF